MTNVLFLGFLMGIRHALDADHIMAIATLTVDKGKISAITQGAGWGVGHTLTLLTVGGAFLYLDFVLSDHIAHVLELVVGVMLAVLGLDLIRSLVKNRIHVHAHKHQDGSVHIHPHSHAHNFRQHTADHEHTHPKEVPLRAIFVGCMHGMAGSSALILLSLQAIQSPLTGLFYIILFGIGSIIGMAALSLAIALPLQYSANRPAWLYDGVKSVVGFATVTLGFYIIYDVGIANGLLIN